MRRIVPLSLVLLLATQAPAAPKPHVIAFGKPISVKCYTEPDETKTVDLKVRPLYVDTRLKEYTTGSPHEITDRLFVVRRAFRLNDNLPQESTSPPRWRWQTSGWLLVDRVTARVSPLSLPNFDPLYSNATWYRDYIAYCSISDDGKKRYAIVAQLGRRKPVVKKLLEGPPGTTVLDSGCAPPAWQRQPTRVTFEPQEGQKLTFSLRGHSVDIATNSDEEEESE